MSTATQKQIDYILSLVHAVTGTRAKFISQVRTELGLSSFQSQKLSSATASQIITEWKKKAEAINS